MKCGKPKIATRVAKLNNARELCSLLNEIISIGGTTAIETQLTEEEFRGYFLQGESCLCCHVAENGLGSLEGFQSLTRHPKLPKDWADIATFARVKSQTGGVGTALFAESKLYAQQSGIVALNATIRADNEGGLNYYEKMGFRTYAVSRDIPLKDGTRVDRISKRFFVE